MMLTIDVRAANETSPPKALSPTLKERLSTPTKSPEKLAKELEANAVRSARLREVHLESVKDRAARDIQRAQDAMSRKLRVAAARTDKIVRKMDAASNKVEAKKEADEAERTARKASREAMALAVAEARKAAGDARSSRAAELLAAEQAASAKHARVVSATAAKGKSAVEHARAVAQARKDKEAEDAAARATTLASRMHAAEARRLESPPHTPERASPRYRVLNEDKVLSETRRKAFDASMAKHAEARAVHLAAVVGKAQAVTARAADVVAKAKAAEPGTDAATAAAKSAMYERLCAAEVAHLSALKTKYAASARVIVVRLDDVLTPRAPPPALIARIGTKPSALLVTAATRQAAAAGRRTLRAHDRALRFVAAAMRRASVVERIGKAQAAKATVIDVATARALAARAMRSGARAHAAERARVRVANAQLKRQQFAAAMLLIGEMRDAHSKAADERHANALCKLHGRTKARRAAFGTRRTALDEARLAKGAAAAARCVAAATKRSAMLEARVAKAHKLAASKSSTA